MGILKSYLIAVRVLARHDLLNGKCLILCGFYVCMQLVGVNDVHQLLEFNLVLMSNNIGSIIDDKNLV